MTSNGHTRYGSYHPTPIPSSAFAFGDGTWWHWSSGVYYGPALLNLKAGQRVDYPTLTDVNRMVAHDEYLQACADVCAGYSYRVGYSDIYWVEEKPQWIHVGATPQHEGSNSYNHWMTTAAGYGIWNTAVAFLALHPSQGKIAVNDMSLPFGGLFDISAGWEQPHAEHNRGKAVDVATSGPYGIPSG